MTITALTVTLPLLWRRLTTAGVKYADQGHFVGSAGVPAADAGGRDAASEQIARWTQTCTVVLVCGHGPAKWAFRSWCTSRSCDTLPVALRYRLQSNPLVGKLTTKYFLPLGTRQVGDHVVFFNFGYEEDPPMALPLSESDEPNRYCIQLYHQTASQVDLTGKEVLEVSCGAGGGASYIARNLGPASYTGLDLNPASIDLCRAKHRLPGLQFVQGDAQNLPFPDESFDAVVNVEASHQYPDFRGFLAEVARVLRPGGHFLYTDSRRNPVVAEWEAPEEGAYAFETLLRHNRAYSGYAPVIGSPWLTAFAQHSPFAEKFQSLGQNRSGTSKFLAELVDLPREEWPDRLRRLLSKQVGLILRRTIDTDRLLSEYGLDSLSSQELRARVEAETGIRISATEINTTVRGLADLMCDKLAADRDAPAPA